MRRAAIYARYSTDLQSDRSIEDQIALCRSWCEREGIPVAKAYTDRAKTSASMMGRDGLLSLMEDARARRFEIVVTEALDRISRDQEDLAHVFKRLEFAGVELRAVHDGAADAITVGLRGIMGEMFLRDLKHKIRRGMSGVIRDGRSAGGRAYGYRPVPGQPGELEIVEAEAEIIRGIFAALLEGLTPREIAADLNRRHVLPPRGARWNASTLQGSAGRGYGILRNRVYRGEIVWNRVRMVRDPETGRRISRVNPAEAWERVDAPDLAIVPAKMFDAVQDRLAERSRAGHAQRRRPKRIFSGLLRCGSCGGGISISKTRRASVWGRCSVAVESGTCDNRREMRIDRIETSVLGRLAEALAEPDYVQAYLTEYHAERQRLAAGQRRETGRIERAAAVARQAADRTLDMLIRGVIEGEAAEARYKAQEAEARAAEAALAEARATLYTEPVQLHPAAPKRYIAAIRDLGQSLADDPKGKAEAGAILRELIDKVTVTPTADGKLQVDVQGKLAALLDAAAPECRGLMVAEVRLVHTPTVALLRTAV